MLFGLACGGIAVAAGTGLLLMFDGSGAHPTAQPPSQSPAAATSAVPGKNPTTIPNSPPPPANSGPPERIDTEKTDRRPLTEQELFPNPRIGLGGRGWQRDKQQTTTPCAWAARGEMATALGTCRRVVRATWVDDRHELAMTLGIAVLPTKQDAIAASQAGNPTDRQSWFRGMRGRTAENIDEAAGAPSFEVRGRYLVYALVTYSDGRTPAPNDPLLTKIGQAAIDTAERPIGRRAR
jgi:hypothetical protein